MQIEETNNYAYNKKLQPFANRLRKEMTKEKDLIEAGFKVLRITDEEVLRNIEGVREGIALFVQEIEQSTPSLPRQRGTTEQEP